MPKINESKRLTRPITIKLTKSDYDYLQSLADAQQLPLAEWSRDRLVEVLKGPSSSPCDHAILAEIAATQDIVIGLLCVLGRDGNLTTQKAQEIVDAAHKRKYRDVSALLKYAYSRVQSGRIIQPGQASEMEKRS